MSIDEREALRPNSAAAHHRRCAAIAAAAWLFIREMYSAELSPAVILTESDDATIYWNKIDTEAGTLLRVRSGRFRGWYLDCDPRVTPEMPLGDMGTGSDFSR